MNPALLAIIVSLIEEAVAQTPAIIADIQAIFNNPSPTPADWEALRAKVLAKTYADFVPASALPPDGTAAPVSGPVTALPDPVPNAAPGATAGEVATSAKPDAPSSSAAPVVLAAATPGVHPGNSTGD